MKALHVSCGRVWAKRIRIREKLNTKWKHIFFIMIYLTVSTNQFSKVKTKTNYLVFDSQRVFQIHGATNNIFFKAKRTIGCHNIIWDQDWKLVRFAIFRMWFFTFWLFCLEFYIEYIWMCACTLYSFNQNRFGDIIPPDTNRDRRTRKQIKNISN